MFEIWETTPPEAARLATATEFAAAGRHLDDICLSRYERAKASGAETQLVSYSFEIRQDGEPVAWLTYTPDVTRPFEGIASDPSLMTEEL